MQGGVSQKAFRYGLGFFLWNKPGFSLCRQELQAARAPPSSQPLDLKQLVFLCLIRAPFRAGANSKADVLPPQPCPTRGKPAPPARMASKGIAGLGGEVFPEEQSRQCLRRNTAALCPSVCGSLWCQHL